VHKLSVDTSTKSRMRQSFLPSCSRVPRPTHWAYRPSERVGRAMAMQDTPGSSKPSVSTGDIRQHLGVARRKSARALARTSGSIAP
jgi:hypothetical protein